MSKFNPDIPSKDDILEFIRQGDNAVSKRDICKAFGIKGQARIPLKKLLKELSADGYIRLTRAKNYAAVDVSKAPSTAVLFISDISLDGDVFARPAEDENALWAEGCEIEVMAETMKGGRAPALGDKILARIHFVKDTLFYADVIKLLARPKPAIIGRLYAEGVGWYLEAVDRREKHDYLLIAGEDQQQKLEDGLLVQAEPLPHSGHGAHKARLKSIIGHDDDPRAISIIAIHEYGLREEFPEKVEAQTEGMKVPPLGKREDLRKIPLVTIDGADARDFDDAVFAEKDNDPNNKGGYHLIVAIADVAHYVRTGSPLDQEAYKRGNSTYFPDRVVPMLPEALSNDLCSLRPREDRACLAMHMWIDEHGKMLRYKPVRALMRSAERLIYEQVQAAMEGVTDEKTESLVEPVLKPLYEVFAILERARQKRGALDIEMPEKQIMIDKSGNMTGVRERARVDSHRLIEEFMILANVAAASALEDKKAACIYRVHDRPSAEKQDNARTFLESLGYNLAKGQVLKPENFNHILRRAKDTDMAHLVNEIVLRSQMQAVYTADNLGHFGLGLKKYAHFTSPIRRYADLFVHRSLIRAFGLGDGGLDEGEEARIAEIADHISKAERASMEAERAAVNRFTASWLSEQAGNSFDGRISGVSRFGIFVRLNDNGAEGIVPIRTLPNDFYVHDEKLHALVGRRTKRVFRLCAPVRVRIAEADRLTGSAKFELLDAERGADIPGFETPKMPSKRSFRKKGSPRKGGKSSDGAKAGGKPPKARKKTTPKHKRKKKN